MQLIEKALKTMYSMFKRICFKVICYKKNVTFKSGCVLGRKSKFEGNNVIGQNTLFSGTLGRGSYIGDNSSLSGKVGRYCSISNNVNVVCGRHPTNTYVSTHPCFFSKRKQAGFSYVSENLFNEFIYADHENNSVSIGNDVWIGYGALIMEGVKIGDGSIIGACSLVTHDVQPYTIVGGIPAKTIKKRFDDNEIEFLLKYKWWDLPEDWIRKNVMDFSDIKKFMHKHMTEVKR